jgi:predicted outer membrane repeat protein
MFKKVIHIFMLVAMLAGLFSFTPATPARAAGLCYVNDNAAGSNNGTSWADAYTSLQSALADTCTEIWVAAGTYKPHASDRAVSFNLESGTAIYGGFAGTETLLSQRDYVANVTILSGDLNGNDNVFTNNGENSYHVVYALTIANTAILDGFTITGGNANGGAVNNYGGGMLIGNNSNPTLTNVTLSSNSAINGGGIYNNSSNPTLTNVTLSGNSAIDYGGGIHNSSSNPILTNVTLSDNSAAFSGGIYNNSSNPTLTNVTLSGNSAISNGGGMFNSSSSPTLTNVTFSSNSASSGGGIYNSNSNPTLTNATFSGNSVTSAGAGMANYNNSSPILTNVTFSGNSAGGGYGGGMYNDSNNNPTLTNVTFSSNTASQGGGIYNSSNSSTLKNVIIANSTGGDCILNSATINASSSNNLIESTGSNACGMTANSQAGSNIIGSDPNLGTLTGSPAYFPLNLGSPAINTGTNTGCPATSQNGLARPQGVTCDIGSYEFPDYDYTGLTLYAKPSATGSGTCLDWANACTLQAAISVANSGNEIWAMQGTYMPHASDRTVSFTLETGVEIYGGFAGTETLLSQRNYATNVTTLSGDLNGNDSGFTNNTENSHHVVTSFGVTNSAVLDGFTISGGNANGTITNRFGGGMYNASTSSPTLNNLTFTNNYGEFGGGTLNENASAPVFNNITFTNNSAASGGGMANYSGSTPTLTNVTFSGNTANSGGGLLNYLSNPTLTNVTFSGNTSGDDSGGGMYNYGNTPILKNVIIANSTNGGDCVLDAGATIHATSSNNLIEGTGGYTCDVTANSQAGSNIIGSDPDLGTLTGSPAYFPLNTGSLAINAGTNTGCPASSQNGVARPFEGTCDIGSFEFDNLPSISSITRAGTSPTSAASVNFNVTFSEDVTGVDVNDFTITKTGSIIGETVASVSGSGSAYTVSVNTGSGTGTLRLDVPNTATIQDANSNPLSGTPFTSGQSYTKVISVTYKSNPANDGWILESTETSNTGGTMNSAATTFTLGDDAADKQYRAILHFDTSSLPDNAVVTSLTLKIKQQGAVTGVSPFTFGSLYVDMRNPAFGNSILELADFNFAAKKIKCAVFNPNPVSGWFSARFNTGGRLYVNRTGVTQLRLYFSVDDNNNNIADFIRFFSGNASADSRPKLLIQYQLP